MRSFQNVLLRSFIIAMGLIIGGLCVFWLPNLAEVSAVSNPQFAYLKYPVLIWMIFTTLPFYVALIKANHLLTLIKVKNAFSLCAVKALSWITICGLAIAGSYVILGVMLFAQNALHPGILIAFAILIFTSVTISFFANLLKLLLEEALQYKNEIDLTI